MDRFNERDIARYYANLPKVRVASYQARVEQQDYLLQGGVALVFVTSVFLTMFGIG